MLFPKCPKCGGKTESAEAGDLDQGIRGASYGLRTQARLGHPHSFLQAGMLAVSIGRQIYKRVPGGGLKRCTACAHEFR